MPVPNDARRPSGGTLDIGSIAGAHELEASVGGHDAHVSRGSADREENTLPALIGTIEPEGLPRFIHVYCLIVDVLMASTGAQTSVRAVIGFFGHGFELRGVTPAAPAATTSPPFDRLCRSQDALAPLNLRELLTRAARTQYRRTPAETSLAWLWR